MVMMRYMRRSRASLVPVVAALSAALITAGCNNSGSRSAASQPSVSPGLLDGTVLLAAEHPLSSVNQQQVLSVLKARLAALHIDAAVTMSGDRAIRLQVPASTVSVVRELGAQGTFEVRPVETIGPKGQAAAPAPGAVPAPVAQSAGKCAVTAPGDAQGWTVACDGAQTQSYQLWPAQLTNADVASASEVQSTSGQSVGQWLVNVSFTAGGKKQFYLVTQRSQGMQLALVVDGVVESAQVITGAINGDAQITVTMNESQARLLATLIGNGALPLALRPQSADSPGG